MKPTRTHLFQFSRLKAAFLYSWKGVCSTFRKEQAFRDEVILSLVLLVVIGFLNVPVSAKCILAASLLVVLVVELLNSALEALVDLVSPDFHELAGMAKDCGSAAVFLTLAAVVLVWLAVLL